jgi:ubiquinone/menaquinone biosynthesis C-methylase UbiE
MKVHGDNDRRRWQDPDDVLVTIGVGRGFTFVDVGCGEGYFTIPVARMVGTKGRVYGLDIDGRVIHRLREKAAKEGLGTIYLKVGSAEDIVFCEACADIVFFGIVLHDFKDPAKVLKNARRMLKPSGRLVNLDWKKEPMDYGPPLRMRFSKEYATRLIEDAEFMIDTVQDAGRYHYLIVATL